MAHMTQKVIFHICIMKISLQESRQERTHQLALTATQDENLYLAQLFNYELWRNSVSYGDRWIVESVFSAFKRMFGEHVTSHKRENMIHELKMKVCLYNKMIVMQ